MTLDEAIKHAKEVAEENETVVNTRTFEDGYTVDEMYCDDTECINEHLARCAKCADEHRQLAEWLKELKHLREQMQESEAEQFARWVATKIFSDMFEDDPVAFAELACRKLAKLGIVRANGDEWELVKPQESEDKENDSN